MKRLTVALFVMACLVFALTASPQAAETPYQIAIIDQSAWVNGQVVDSFIPVNAGEGATVCLWVDPSSGRDGFDGGFDFLVCYDPAVMTYLNSGRGPDLHPDWEYFTWRAGTFPDTCLACPGSFVRVLGIADILNSATPPDAAYSLAGCIAELTFAVGFDQSLLGGCYPIGFCGADCGDNVITNRTGDSLFIPLSGVNARPGYSAAGCAAADSSGRVVQYLHFTPGQLCINPPIPRGGDINLNGIQYEIADAILFGYFFVYGVNVFDPAYYADQIDESEVNCDSVPATTVDLMYMINIIAGNLQPCRSYAARSALSSVGPIQSIQDTMVLSDASVAPGDTFTVDMYMRTTDTLGVYNFRLRYDPSLIAPVTDTLLTPEVEFMNSSSFDLRGAALPTPGLMTGVAVDFVGADPVTGYLPGAGVMVRTRWMAQPSVTPQITQIAFESDPDFPASHNTLADCRAEIWKRPTLINSTVTIAETVCNCPHQGDFDANGYVAALDLSWIIDVVYFGVSDVRDADCPATRADIDADGVANSVDLALTIDHVYFGGAPPVDPCAP